MVRSARFEAYSSFARGSPSNLLWGWFGNLDALFLIAVPPLLGMRTVKAHRYAFHVSIVWYIVLLNML